MRAIPLFLSTLPLLALAAPAPQPRTLWPSREATLHAQPDSRRQNLPDGAVAVATGTTYMWPGLRLDFRAGKIDLSAYATVTVAVSNTTDRITEIQLAVKGRETVPTEPFGRCVLAPRANGEITAELCVCPWRFDADLALEGMNGTPQNAGGRQYHPRDIRSLHIFRVKDGSPSGFTVTRITAAGKSPKVKRLDSRTFFPFVDRFGQFMHDTWPGKTRDESDLIADREQEKAWLARHPGSPLPDADRYGGWAGGPRRRASGHFRTEKIDGKWWLIDPEGHLFFSHGITAVHWWNRTPVTRREHYFSWLPARDDPAFAPGYSLSRHPAAHGFYKDPRHTPFENFCFAFANARRKYGAGWQSICCDLTHARLRAWGFNTIGNWSDRAITDRRRTPYTATLSTDGPPIEGSSGWWGKLIDPFADAFARQFRARAGKEAARSADDPWCIGWFVDNELSWGHTDGDIGQAVLRSPAAQPAKQAARDLLAKKYGTIDRLNAAWGSGYADWSLWLSATNHPSGGQALKDCALVTRAVARKYFRTILSEMKAVAPRKLYLGARFGAAPAVVYEEAARFCDVVSVNTYAHTPLHDLPPAAADKPMLNGEFHFGALDRGHFHGGLVRVPSQADRARAYRKFVTACLDHPRYVGTHWYKWMDQCLTGRPDGENYQIGFLTITDKPQPEMVEAARTVAATLYRRRLEGAKD